MCTCGLLCASVTEGANANMCGWSVVKNLESPVAGLGNTGNPLSVALDSCNNYGALTYVPAGGVTTNIITDYYSAATGTNPYTTANGAFYDNEGTIAKGVATLTTGNGYTPNDMAG